MEKKYNRLKAESFFEIESMIYLAHCFSSKTVERTQRFDFWQMYYCADGLLKLKIDGQVVEIPKYHAVVLAPGENERAVVRSDNGEEGEFFVISFESTSPDMYYFAGKLLQLYGDEPFLLSDLCKTGRKVLEPIKTNQSKQGLCERAESHPAVLQYVKISLEQFFIKLYCRLNRIDSIPSEAEKVNQWNYKKDIVSQAEEFMHEHIGYKLSILDIATALGVNATSLRIAYKKETGKSMMRDFGDMKAAEAKRLIRETGLNFTQIADRLGFLSLYHFSRFFKEKDGVTLSEYSRSVGKKA